MVYGVSRIALPSCDLDDRLRAGRDFRTRSHDFFAGPENRLAVPALERLLAITADDAQEPVELGLLFSPLVLLGPTGLGKSHLARGLARHWHATYGDTTVEYLTAVDFARQLRAAREEGLLDEFRQRLSCVQLLVLEDLHRLPASIYVQRELRDTLDVLIDSGACIVVTSQSPPAAIPELEAGLRDRLSSGLTVRLQNPGPEARVELLREAANQRGLSLDEQQLRQLAHKLEGTPPQLFRALSELELSETQLAAESSTAGQLGERPPLRFKQILGVVARYFSLTQAALCSSARRKSLVYARGIAVHLARSLTDLSYAQIGQHLGRRDHTTVMHASRSIEKQLAADAATQQDVEELKRILTAV